jgi:hypothetical protein
MFIKFETVHDIHTTFSSLQDKFGKELQIPLNNLRHLNKMTSLEASQPSVFGWDPHCGGLLLFQNEDTSMTNLMFC